MSVKAGISQKKTEKEKKNRKILVIGLDGAEPSLIEKWTKQNKLPTLKRLIENGAYGRIKSTIPPSTAPAWSTFMTGKNPGKHGIFDFFTREEGSYNLSLVNPSSRKEETIWEIIGEHGMKVGVFYVPLTYPPSKVNGFMVTGMLTPGGEYTYPSFLKEQLNKEVQGYELSWPELDAERKPERFLEGLYEVTSKKHKAVMWLIKNYDWNFLCMNFDATDVIQHKMWHHMDPSHPRHNEALREKYGNAIFNVYEKMDEILEEITKEVEDNAAVIIFSDHGGGKVTKFIHVNNFLVEIGVLKLKRNLKTLLKYFLFKLGFTPTRAFKWFMKLGLAWKIKSEMAGAERKVGNKTRGRLLNRLKRISLSLSDVDWKRTKAYSIGHYGQIYLNVKGREPFGIVNPGEEYENVRQYIIERLKSLRDPVTGEKVIKKVYRKEEIYKGCNMDRGPDLCFISKNLDYLGYGGRGWDSVFASSKIIEDSFGNVGTHKLQGIFILKGNCFAPHVKLKNLSLEDIAPTVLYYLGVPIPRDMDGRVPVEAFTKTFLKRNPIVSAETSKKEKKLEEVYSKEEEEEIKERLRKLGYL